MLSKQKKWYALYTKPRWEKKVDQQLLKKGIESWCPVQKLERFWSDRKKIIEDPLFKSYVFVFANEDERLDIIRTDGVLNFVHYLNKPAVINEEEIELIKKFLAVESAKIEVLSEEGFKKDMKVKITQGVFMNNTGTVIRDGKKKVYVQLQSLGQVMIVEFPAEYLSFDDKK